MIKNLLAHPKTKNLSIDDPKTTLIRREIIKEKKFLKKLYAEWYKKIEAEIPSDVEGKILEIGSGAGFAKEIFGEQLVTSELFECDGVDMVVDATNLSFGDSTLKAIVMTDVFHHIPNVRRFLHEANRTLVAGGGIVMIEPWSCAWSRFIYKNLHHEPFVEDAKNWEFPSSGPLSGANGALPWIVFERDREIFEKEFPNLKIDKNQILMPFSYLVSGGVSMKSLVFGFIYEVFRLIEKPLEKMNIGMFCLIKIKKVCV